MSIRDCANRLRLALTVHTHTHRERLSFFTTVRQGRAVKGREKGIYTPPVCHHSAKAAKRHPSTGLKILKIGLLPLRKWKWSVVPTHIIFNASRIHIFFNLSTLMQSLFPPPSPNRLPELLSILYPPIRTFTSPHSVLACQPHPPCLLCYILFQSLSLSGLIELRV